MTFDVFSAAGSGFTKRVITNFGDIAQDATVVSMGSYSATAPLRASAPWVMQMATFRGQSSSNPAFTLSGISPSSGSASGGTKVTITGTGVTAGATVTFGGSAATNVAVTNSTTITATTPAHAAGAVNVVVTNGNGQSVTLHQWIYLHRVDQCSNKFCAGELQDIYVGVIPGGGLFVSADGGALERSDGDVGRYDESSEFGH